MSRVTSADNSSVSATHWKTLRYFSIYRLCIAGLLLLPSFYFAPAMSLIGQRGVPYQSQIVVTYFVANLISLIVLHAYPRYFNRQLSIQVLLDVGVLTWLAHAGDGLRDGFGVLL